MPKLKSGIDVSAEGDMTSMIDMTFQLIAFFMILINFADDSANQTIKLPASELAIPPEAPPEDPIVLQMDAYGKVLYSGDGFVDLPIVRQRLNVKKSLIVRQKGADKIKDATVIIRAHRNVATKYVREMLQMCQELGFETFAFRAASQARD
jgi:biopolymer transport protein ExbD